MLANTEPTGSVYITWTGGVQEEGSRAVGCAPAQTGRRDRAGAADGYMRAVTGPEYRGAWSRQRERVAGICGATGGALGLAFRRAAIRSAGGYAHAALAEPERAHLCNG